MIGLSQRARFRQARRRPRATRPDLALARLGAEGEVQELIDAVAMLFCFDQKLRLVLPVLKPRNTQHASRVRRSRKASERPSHGPQQGLGLLRRNIDRKSVV